MFDRDSLAWRLRRMLIVGFVNGARFEAEPTTVTMTFIERIDETQAVPDAQRGGVHEDLDIVTWLQLYGTDTLYALRRLRRGIRHYTLGSTSDRDT